MTFSSVCHSVFKPEHVISFGVMSCPIRGPTSVLAVHSGRCGESNGELEVLHKGKIDTVCILFPSYIVSLMEEQDIYIPGSSTVWNLKTNLCHSASDSLFIITLLYDNNNSLLCR